LIAVKDLIFNIFSFLIIILKAKWSDFVRWGELFFGGGGFAPLAPGWLRPCMPRLHLGNVQTSYDAFGMGWVLKPSECRHMKGGNLTKLSYKFYNG